MPIGETLLVTGLRRRFPNADFFASTTRPPSVYRGNPFVVEVGLAFGGDMPLDETAEIMRFANRVPLQYQPKACAISESIYDTNWRAYELQQPKGGLPVGPLAVVVHLASVWVPFTSEAKEAVAHYDELLREMKLAVQECGRKLASYLRAQHKAQSEQKRLGIFQRYIPEVSGAMAEILGLVKKDIEKFFNDALPNFVKLAKEEDTPDEPTPAGKPSMPPPASEPPPALGPGPKAKKGMKVIAAKPAKAVTTTKAVKAGKTEKPVAKSASSTKAAKPAPTAKTSKKSAKSQKPGTSSKPGKRGEQLSLVE